MEELGTAAYDAVPLLAHAREIARHVDEYDEGHGKGIAHAHEARRLLRAGGVQAPAEAQRIVGHHAHGASAESTEGDDDIGSPARVELDHGALVEEALDQRMHVVGALR